MTQPHLTDVFANGQAYEPYVGRWSRRVAEPFLDWLAVPDGSRWLDIGCGTGALSQTILRQARPAGETGLDRSPGFAYYAHARTADARATFTVADATALPLPPEAFDAVVSGLVLNFVPRPAQALAEMARVTRPGGLVGVYVWDYAEGMQFMRHFWDAAAELDEQAAALDAGRRFSLCQPEPLLSLFTEAGLGEVDVEGIEIDTRFKDFDDFWQPMLGGQGSAPTYLMRVSEERRAALRERLRARLPYAADGSIPLLARAWAVRGVRRETR